MRPAAASPIWVACTAIPLTPDKSVAVTQIFKLDDSLYGDSTKLEKIREYQSKYAPVMDMQFQYDTTMTQTFLDAKIDKIREKHDPPNRYCVGSATREGLLKWYEEQKQKADYWKAVGGVFENTTLKDWRPGTRDVISVEMWPD